MFTKQPAFECHDDRIQPGGYSRLLLFPGIPQTCDYRGLDMYNIIKTIQNIERERDLGSNVLEIDNSN
jgi:hypothetical protein